jgi:hypothetical protein
LRVEQLEARNLLSAYPLSAAQVRHAYGFDQVAANGAGQTIAIVDAYDAPTIFKDVDTFDQTYSWTAGGASLYSQFGASGSFLTKAQPGGQTRASSGWAQEISLDVEWAHAIAPAAKILLVEAQSNSLTDLLAAVDYATNHGAQVVSMSWGAGEFSGETAYDFHFNHTGVTYVASAGDSGSVTQWPAVSPYVVAVGGTSLSVDASGNYLGETAWSGSGGGVSGFEPKPSYQSGVPQSGTHRTSPDVAYNADPNTGFAVYDSYVGGFGWGQYGGTSAGAPQWAGLLALVNQGRTTGPLSSSGALNGIYGLLGGSTSFHDVAGGSSGTHSPGSGYDLVTGVGTPQANNLIPYLRTVSGTGPVVVQTASGGTGTSGSAHKHTVPAPTPTPVVTPTSTTPDVQAVFFGVNLPTQTTTAAAVVGPPVRVAEGASVPATPQAVLAPAPQPLNFVPLGRVGESPALPDAGDQDEDAGDKADRPADGQRSSTPPAATPVNPADEDDLSALPLRWDDAVTACFADPEGGQAVLIGSDSAGAAFAGEAGISLESAAAVAGLFLVVGGRDLRAADRDEEQRRRQPGGA